MTLARLLLALSLSCLFWLAPAPALAASGCPGAVVYQADTTSQVDAGWTGITHDMPIIGWSLRFGVDSCTGSTVGSCGDCALTGLIANAGGSNQRCSNDLAIKCSDDTPCAGGGGHCAFYATPPNPAGAPGIAVCVVNEVTAAVSGTVNIESGALTVDVPMRASLYRSVIPFKGCPICQGDPTPNDNLPGGTCDTGARAGQPCDANATSPLPDFGTTSFDCPPAADKLIGSLALASQALTLSTGTSSRTLTAASPGCTARPPFKCYCDTCNDLAGTPCSSNADCSDPPGPIGPICGGKRCLSGSNAGAACTVNSECSGGGICGRPGEPPKPNDCIDDTNTPADDHDCTDTVPVDGEGECLLGPIDTHCAPPETDRGCLMPSDCPITANCVAENRHCYPLRGDVGESVSVSGTATPRTDNASAPTDLGALFCIGAANANIVNNPVGLPGLGRMELHGTLTYADEVAIENVGPATTVSTDAGEGDGATATDVVETAVTTPAGGAGGEVTILETTPVGAAPPGFSLLGNLVQITAPAGSASDPLALTFTIDQSAAPGQFAATVVVRRNGVAVGDCTNVPPAAIAPDPCVFSRADVGDDLVIGVYTSAASDWDLLGPAVLPTTPTPTFTVPVLTATPTPVATVTPVPTTTASVVPVCAPTPEVCRTPVASGKGFLSLTDKSPDDKDQLQWKWSPGTDTPKPFFGDPLTTDDYVLCLYDNGGLLATLIAPKGGLCANKPCWADKTKGFQYKDKDGSPNGITQLRLTAGFGGKAKIQVKGKGMNLPMPALGALASPVTVQIKRSGGGFCFGASYTFPPAVKNDAVYFKDKND